MRSNILNKILKEMPLETRVRTTIESHFIMENGGHLLMPLDEDGNELPSAVEANRLALEKAKPLVDSVLNDIKKWKEDGCPE